MRKELKDSSLYIVANRAIITNVEEEDIQ